MLRFRLGFLAAAMEMHLLGASLRLEVQFDQFPFFSISYLRSVPYILVSSLTFPLEITLLSLYNHLEALQPCNMADVPVSTTSEDGLPLQWGFSNRPNRKSGCSNIFTGVSLTQLHRLFRKAGDRDAEHRAKLVWRGLDGDTEREEEAKEEKGKERWDEAGLAQALVGLRVRARNKAGFRAEGHKDPKWHKAAGYLR